MPATPPSPARWCASSTAAPCPRCGARPTSASPPAVADEELATLADLDTVRPVMNSLAELQWIAGLNRQWLEKASEALNMLTLETLRYEGKLQGEQLRAEVGIYERAMEAAVKTNAAIARLNLDERLVAVEEHKADMILDAFARSLMKAGVTAEELQKAAYAEFARRMKTIPGEIEPPEAQAV